MSDDRNYKSLNLDRDCIKPVVESFCAQQALKVRSIDERPGGPGLRVTIGKAGIENSTLDIYFIQDGTSTLMWNLGQNKELSQALADKLYETINPDEFQSVNMSLKGIEREQIQTIIELLPENDTKKFIINSHTHHSSVHWRINCEEHGDSLMVIHHPSLILQIQGRPLSCYRKLVYLLTEILDTASLEMVLSRREESATEIIRKEVAAEFLKKLLPNAYENLPSITHDLLVSGQCVKIAGPSLPEYSMLLFPELRSLEGALKSRLAHFGFDSDNNDFGYFFDSAGAGNYKLRASFNNHITDVELRSKLANAYAFFNKHRHSLFHMESFEEGSRKITGLTQLLSLSQEAYTHLDNLYK
ncbi:type II toxin-antitoxin system RnlA family toxin [Dryocola clanedunensis]